MSNQDIQLLALDRWDVICESPFEIEMMSEDGMVQVGFASGEAAKIILDNLKRGEFWNSDEG